MWFRLLVESLAWGFAYMMFMWLVGIAFGISFNGLVFTPFGFIVFYLAGLTMAWSIK
ncbi:Uncharacterised protein [uncultured archaeon]|nr:Uncharacterised protein [uncultured archaeon]